MTLYYRCIEFIINYKRKRIYIQEVMQERKIIFKECTNKLKLKSNLSINNMGIRNLHRVVIHSNTSMCQASFTCCCCCSCTKHHNHLSHHSPTPLMLAGTIHVCSKQASHTNGYMCINGKTKVQDQNEICTIKNICKAQNSNI